MAAGFSNLFWPGVIGPSVDKETAIHLGLDENTTKEDFYKHDVGEAGQQRHIFRCIDCQTIEAEASGIWSACRCSKTWETIPTEGIYSAKQVLQIIHEDPEAMNPPLPELTAEVAPAIQNISTNGSVKNPTMDKWQLAGYGVWIPKGGGLGGNTPGPPADGHVERGAMVLDQHLASEHLADGVGIWGNLTGLRCSSTRAEVAAATAAMLKSGPVCIATDSQALQQRGRSIAAHMAASREAVLKTDEGALSLGGTLTPLHKASRGK